MKIVVTGGAGFIGSALVRHLVRDRGDTVVTVDALTYAAPPGALDAVAGDPRHRLVHADVCDRAALDAVLAAFDPDHVVHLAAETHVDRSIDGPAAFVRTNVVGTATLLDAVVSWWRSRGEPAAFRLLHVSTDEVFGSMDVGLATEASPYQPRSPYAASKAGADHLVRAWHTTYGLPTIVSHCANTYGPYQFPEKLVPLLAVRALTGRDLPLYGDGSAVRDWLHVGDHARALAAMLDAAPGETFALAGAGERTNLQIAHAICDAVGCGRDRVAFVADRPGHDRRYALDGARTRAALGLPAPTAVDDGIRATVAWYAANRPWWEHILATRYDTGRLGAPR